jgi:hypothetical protein
MGYTTDFEGGLTIKPSLSEAEVGYINKFSETRRMSRDVEKLNEKYEGKFGLPGKLGQYGVEGEFFVGDEKFSCNNDGTVNNLNSPSKTQPGLWAQWVVNEEGEKFYHYIEWLCYYINNFFKPWGKTLNGVIKWEGEEFGDNGEIHVKNNKVFVVEGDTITFVDYVNGETINEKIATIEKSI